MVLCVLVTNLFSCPFKLFSWPLFNFRSYDCHSYMYMILICCLEIAELIQGWSEYLCIGVAMRGYNIMIMVGRSCRRMVELAEGAMWG